jgi:YfiR/HmsC-like
MELLEHSMSGISKSNPLAGPRMQRRRWAVVAGLVAAWLALLLWMAACLPATELHAQTQDSLLEYQVKAAFLLNFTKFVEWPATAFAAPNAPITICVIGQDPFGAILDRTVEGESVGTHRIRARRLLPDDDLKSCHILFISQSERGQVAQIVSRLHDSSVLTVSELPGFADAGGMIEFLIEAGKTRFYINAATAGAAGLKLSSRLLRVAKGVKDSRG